MRTTTASLRRAALVLLGLSLAGGTTAAAADPTAEPGPQPTGAQLAQVRAATAAYHDVDAALADGYAQVSPCVPNMGYHYQRMVPGTDPTTGEATLVPHVSADAADLAAHAPEILVYAPQPDGDLRLVAVEYATWDPTAQLFGQSFDPPHGGPPFHTLHAWIWQGNPAGTFHPTNPNVRCE